MNNIFRIVKEDHHYWDLNRDSLNAIIDGLLLHYAKSNNEEFKNIADWLNKKL